MRFHRLPHLALSAALALALVGCTDVDSTNLKTSGIQATFTVTARGTGTAETRATFQVDDSTLTWVTLKDGDEVSATMQGGDTKTLEESNVLGIVEYAAYFTDGDAEGTTYTFDLERANDTSAPGNNATIPAPFSVTSPSDSSLTFSRANDDIVVTYDNAGTGDRMAYEVTGGCITTSDQTVSGDTGTLTIPKGTLAMLPNASVDTCPIQIDVMRIREGELDSAFAGGGSYGKQVRTISVNSAP